MSILNAILTFNLVMSAIWGAGSAGVLPAMDEMDREILDAYLKHTADSARYCTPERMAKFASQPEDITWQASQYIKMPLIAHKLTDDAAWLNPSTKRAKEKAEQPLCLSSTYFLIKVTS